LNTEIGKKLYNDFPATKNEMKKNEVIITDINIPFWSIVRLIIKISIAAIPAGIVLAVIYGLIFMFIVASQIK